MERDVSGGCLDYLFTKALDENADHLDVAACLLRAHGHEVAAARTEEAAAALRRAEALRAELEDVLKAVEWVGSGDWGAERLKEAVEKWQTALKQAHSNGGVG